MCGRYTLTRPGSDVADLLGLPEAPALEPRYNIAPTQRVFAARAPAGQGPPEGAWLRWGLVPSWAADPRIGNKLLNARSETAAEKPAFRAAFAKRRCLLPADGFYEWQSVGGKKRPIHFRFRDGRAFALAGLWEAWHGPDGVVETCAVLTTGANDVVRPVHDRMPVILRHDQFAAWLDPANVDRATLRSWLVPHDPAEMIAVPANSRVNSPRNEGPECLAAA